MSTGADKEDHVSMGGFSARKVVVIVENMRKVLEIEAMAASRAICIRKSELPEFEIPAALKNDYERYLVNYLDQDRLMQDDYLRILHQLERY